MCFYVVRIFLFWLFHSNGIVSWKDPCLMLSFQGGNMWNKDIVAFPFNTVDLLYVTIMYIHLCYDIIPLIARFMGPTWGPSGADRTHDGPMNHAIWDSSVLCHNVSYDIIYSTKMAIPKHLSEFELHKDSPYQRWAMWCLLWTFGRKLIVF